MKREKRLEYLILAAFQDDKILKLEMCTSLCAWCRYCSWEGTGSCYENYPVCEHPIRRLAEDEEMNMNAYSGGDCWGFRPAYRREDCVDIVGLWLQGKHVDWDSVPRIGRKETSVKQVEK
ncbi:MAG: hypothetical protein PHI12_14310 [Dehalococcoidales bacterium]|nr:hypothetical protein [Dehalococcoidales bacterium]